VALCLVVWLDTLAQLSFSLESIVEDDVILVLVEAFLLLRDLANHHELGSLGASESIYSHLGGSF